MSSTCTIELQDVGNLVSSDGPSKVHQPVKSESWKPSKWSKRSKKLNGTTTPSLSTPPVEEKQHWNNGETNVLSSGSMNPSEGTLPSPTTEPVEEKQKWNHPKVNVYRTFSTFWCFMVLGANDAAIGALIPYVSTLPLPSRAYADLVYSLKTTITSLTLSSRLSSFRQSLDTHLPVY